MVELLPWLVYVMMIGACVGSFLNVVIYRLPEGRSIVHPPSSCPKCGSRLKWYDNVPVLAWLWLRGRCRSCKNPISVQYPLVEALVAVMFGGLFVFEYMTPWAPAMSGPGVFDTWPIYLVHLVLLSGLLAATVIDARTFMIPLSITWVVAVTALVLLPLGVTLEPHAAERVPLPPMYVGGVMQLDHQRLEMAVEPYQHSSEVRLAVVDGSEGDVTVTALPHVSGGAMGMAFGGAIGLLIANVLLRKRVLPLSFADEEADVAIAVPEPTPEQLKAERKAKWKAAMAGEEEEPTEAEAEAEFEPHPFPRREVCKELLFLALPLVCAAIGWFVMGGGFDGGFAGGLGGGLGGGAAEVADPIDLTPGSIGGPGAGGEGGAGGVAVEAFAIHILPAGVTWLEVAAGVVLGYLVGGLTVWAVRILGTLAFGREAMGLGDVHLMAAVGAVLGWQSAFLAFFVAPFLGLTWAVGQMIVAARLRKRFREIPYGPHLAVASVVVLLLREPLFTLIGIMMRP